MTMTATAAAAAPKRQMPSDSINRNRNRNKQKAVFEETIYRGVGLDVAVAVASAATAPNDNGTGSRSSHVSNSTASFASIISVPLPVAVRSCWPDLFPTMSSAKKSIRKGIFFVKHSNENANSKSNLNSNANANASRPNKIKANKRINSTIRGKEWKKIDLTDYQNDDDQQLLLSPQKGKGDTRIFVGDTLLRKLLPATSTTVVMTDDPNNDDDNNNAQQRQYQQLQRFRTRGPSTDDVISRAIGGKLQLAYLDPHLAVVVKPHGMPVQKVLLLPVTDRKSGGKAGTVVAATTATANDNDGVDSSSKNSSNNSRVISMHELLLHCLPPLLPRPQRPQQQQQQSPHSADDRTGKQSSNSNDIDIDSNDDCVGSGGSDDPLRRPAAIHRLDRPTYGLLIVARTRPSARFLGRVFEERTETLVKRYRSIVHGHLPGIIIDGDNDDDKASGKCNENDNGSISGDANPSKRDGGTFVRSSLSGKDCLTEYFIVKKLVVAGDGGGFHPKVQPPSPAASAATRSKAPQQQQKLLLTLVDLVLHTGRKHQLRRHMASLGHPIVGDTRYGRSKDDEILSNALVSSLLVATTTTTTITNTAKQQLSLPLMLAAVEITFPHPLGASSSSCSVTMAARTVTDSNSSSNEAKYKYCVMAKDSKHSFDASRRTLNVAISMPDSMQYILRNSSSSSGN
jgi:23S rRNA-/tRNA-specific pseudouridylate synthase